MENIFNIAEHCLLGTSIEEKLTLTRQATEKAIQGQLAYVSVTQVLPISRTRFPRLPELKLPREMPKRQMNTAHGKAAFFHALTHIEFIAIYLAWDIIYRFRGLPVQFYQDWLGVVGEEAQHFVMLRNHLQSLGMDYGDLPAHKGLWAYAEKTSQDILARLALVPRFQEAKGLDVTPAMIDKFKELSDQESVRVLSRIYADEVRHVGVGSYWFKLLCQEKKLVSDSTFQNYIARNYKGQPKGPINREMRIIAGFSNIEIDWLESRANEKQTDI